MTRTYGAPLGRAVLLFAAGLACAGGAVVLTPLWAPAVVLVLLAAQTVRCRSALLLTPDGVDCLGGLHRRFAAWHEVTAVRVRVERHFLAFGQHLEIDLSDDTLVVLSSLQLGAPADEVSRVLHQALTEVRRPGTSRPS